MRLRAACVLAAMLWVVPAPAQEKAPSGNADKPGKTPATAPAATTTQPAAKVPDLCKDAVDPYNPMGERAKFFNAAGVDNELGAKEFEANRKAQRPFVRRFDTWKGIVAFDKNKNGTIDWFEANAYRKALRKSVLAKFDANKDSSLRGPERLSANRALMGKWIPQAAGEDKDKRLVGFAPAPVALGGAGEGSEEEALRRYDADGDGQLSRQERRNMYRGRAEQQQKEMLEKYDTDGDGEIAGEERTAMASAMQEDFRRRAEEARQSAMDQWDTNKDGEIDDEEREAIGESFRQRAEQWRRDRNLRRFDANEDGKLDEEETAVMEKAEVERQRFMEEAREIGEQRRKEFMEKFDTDGDGDISDKEREGIREHFQKRAEEVRKKMDADGDGEVTREEGGKYWEGIRDKYDEDGDGELSTDERLKMMREESGSMMMMGSGRRRGGRRGEGNSDTGRRGGRRRGRGASSGDGENPQE